MSSESSTVDLIVVTINPVGMYKKGGAIVRTINMMGSIRYHGGRSCLLTLKDSRSSTKDFKDLEVLEYNLSSLSCRLIRAIPYGGESLRLLFLTVSMLHKLIETIQRRNPRILQAEHIWTVIPVFLAARIFNLKTVYSSHCVEIELARQSPTSALYRALVLVLETLSCRVSTKIIASSYRDLEVLVRLYGSRLREKTVVLPGGVDVDIFTPDVDGSKIRNSLGLSGKKVLIFHGNFNYYPNRVALGKILNYITPKLRRIPFSLAFLIVGEDPQIPKDVPENVIFTGTVEDLSLYIASADIAVVPVEYGSGVKTKLLEYLASGKPIVSTLKGIEGTTVKDGVHALLSKNVDERFIENIRKILVDPNLADRLGRNARMLSYDLSLTQLAESYEKLLDELCVME